MPSSGDTLYGKCASGRCLTKSGTLVFEETEKNWYVFIVCKCASGSFLTKTGALVFEETEENWYVFIVCKCASGKFLAKSVTRVFEETGKNWERLDSDSSVIQGSHVAQVWPESRGQVCLRGWFNVISRTRIQV